MFDLNKVDSKRRNNYGMNKIGQGCLLAKRLVKQGITFVEVENGGWDTHVNNFDKLDTEASGSRYCSFSTSC